MKNKINELKARKDKVGLSNYRLAKLTGYAESSISRLFSGKIKKPSYRFINEIEKILKNYEN